MLSGFREKLRTKELRNFRLLNLVAAIIVIVLGFIFESAYHDGYILMTGLLCSTVLTANYFFSFYSPIYKRYFSNITFVSVILLHFWAVYVAYARNFSIDVLLPVSISTFTFSLIFNRFYKSLIFVFVVTTFMLSLMLIQHSWQSHYTITLIALYAGAFLAEEILKRKSEFYAEIQKQEKRYVTLVENMNDGLIYLDTNDRIVLVNEMFSKISGYESNEILSHEDDFFNSHFTPEGDIKFIKKLKNGEAFKSELRILDKKKNLIWVQVSAAPHYEDGKKEGTIIVYTDISALKETQHELKKREEGYRTFIEQSAVGIWRAEYLCPIPINLPLSEQIDLLLDTGIISECNEFMASMYGYHSSSELIGRRIRDFYYFENNFDEQKTRDLMRDFISNNYKISNAESKELDKQGKPRFMLNNNIGIVENDCVIRTWGVQTDITDRKRTEKELTETNHELDTFFYKASHDLKGPLASVMGIVNLARMENDNALMEKYFGMIETSVKRLDQTLMDLIELAKTRRGSNKLSEMNVRTLVEEILYSLRHLPNFDKIKYDLKIDTEIDLVADKVLVLSVFQNLIHNAINYCNRQAPWICIQIISSGNGIELEISDNGQGIPDKIKSRVFEMFYRGNSESGGSGLGLFIVKNALEKLKGKISFQSKEGQGTTFTVYIPSAAVFA